MGFTLRVSVTEHCQLRCLYCLPKKIPSNDKRRLAISDYEILAEALLRFKIDKIRFTGGEPLIRHDLHLIMKPFRRLMGPLALTTNGLLFHQTKNKLIDAGLSSVTFHLDTLNQQKYEKIMGRGKVTQVLRAIESALKASLNVKVNMVVQRGINDDEIWDFLQWSRRAQVQVRFIELMDTGSAQNYVKNNFISGAEIITKLSQFSVITPLMRKNASDPAEQFLAQKLGISFGLIASDTRPFCSNCNRIRLSADGKIFTCLYQPVGYDLGFLSDIDPKIETLISIISQAISKKTSFHPAISQKRRFFSMSQLGG